MSRPIRPSYPASIPHRAWPVDRTCPLYVRTGNDDYCKRNVASDRLRLLHFGCAPDCEDRARVKAQFDEWEHIT